MNGGSDHASEGDLVDLLRLVGDDIDRELAVAQRDDVVGDVVAAIDSRSRSGTRRTRLLIAVASVTIVALGVVAVPDSRRAVARWFGLDGVEIELEPSSSAPASRSLAETVGPGESTIVTIDGRQILVSAISATLDDGLITKTVGATDQLQQVDVDGAPGLWVGGGSHDVLYRVAGSDVVVERVAANTLLWNDRAVLYRVEGFDRLETALAFARSDVVATGD